MIFLLLLFIYIVYTQTPFVGGKIELYDAIAYDNAKYLDYYLYISFKHRLHSRATVIATICMRP